MCLSFLNHKSTRTTTTKKSPSLRHQPTTPRSPTTPTSPFSAASASNKHRSSSSTSSSYKFSTASSTHSSRRSLSNITHSLSENPLTIFPSSQIHSAISTSLRSFHRSSSSTSFRCILHNKPVLIIQRRLRRPIIDLRRTLSQLCKSHHLSLVNLLGASLDNNNHIYLVYDFVDGASLSDCLYNPRNPNYTVLSTWISRVRVAADIAHGLDYVHNCSGVGLGFVHNRIKSSSIIVTEPDFGSKLCHFGTAQLCGELRNEDDDDGGDEKKGTVVMSTPRGRTGELKRTRSVKFEGTRGYMSPEYKSSGIPTMKSDVFAFGVVLLELVSGEQPLGAWMDEETGVIRTVSLVGTAREVVGGGGDYGGGRGSGVGGDGWGRLRRWVDRRLRDSYPVDVAEKLVKLAVECVDEDPDRRPDMNRVAGLISKMYLESKSWAEKFGIPADITASLAPR